MLGMSLLSHDSLTNCIICKKYHNNPEISAVFLDFLDMFTPSLYAVLNILLLLLVVFWFM